MAEAGRCTAKKEEELVEKIEDVPVERLAKTVYICGRDGS